MDLNSGIIIILYHSSRLGYSSFCFGCLESWRTLAITNPPCAQKYIVYEGLSPSHSITVCVFFTAPSFPFLGLSRTVSRLLVISISASCFRVPIQLFPQERHADTPELVNHTFTAVETAGSGELLCSLCERPASRRSV